MKPKVVKMIAPKHNCKECFYCNVKECAIMDVHFKMQRRNVINSCPNWQN